MKIALSTIGKFHTFDLARELLARGCLTALFTGYPRFKLRDEGLPAELVNTFPWIHAPYMGFRFRPRLGVRVNALWEILDRAALDRFVSRRMPHCDVFVGLSGSALESGKVAQAQGSKYVCDRGSTHIRTQDRLLREEHSIWGVPYRGIDPRIIEKEEAEYARCDAITVPSAYNVESFVANGVPPQKLRLVPYGVNLERFAPTEQPDPQSFDILFVGALSLRKGVAYLLEAYTRLEHPRKSLTLAGTADPEFIELMKRRALWPVDLRVLGHVPQPKLRNLMSRSHVLVLPSIEEGLAMVQAQAMACGCPVIGTEHTGAPDLFSDGAEGIIVPIRDAEAILDALRRLASDRTFRDRLSAAALRRVTAIGGWHAYGEKALAAYGSLF